MRFSLFPRTFKFYDLFLKQNQQILLASNLLREIFCGEGDVQHKCKEIQLIEAEGNSISRDIARQLSMTFITPLDREDIHEINMAQEALLNVIKTIGNRVSLQQRHEPTEEARELIYNFHFMLEEIHKILPLVLDKKDAGESVRRVISLKEQTDMVLLKALANIYNRDLTKPDAIAEIINLSQIYDRIEKATIRAENLANMLEGISHKYA